MKAPERTSTSRQSTGTSNQSAFRFAEVTNRSTSAGTIDAFVTGQDDAFCLDSEAELDSENDDAVIDDDLSLNSILPVHQGRSTNASKLPQSRPSASEYKKSKRDKLQESDANLRNASSQSTTSIFQGLAIHVTGYTQPSARELRKMIVSHGGTFLVFLDDWAKVTHIVASQLAGGKAEEFITKGKARARGHGGVRVIKPEWVVECVKARKLVNCEQFSVGQGNGQAKLLWHKGKDTESPFSGISPKVPPRSDSTQHSKRSKPCLSGIGNFLHLPFSAQPIKQSRQSPIKDPRDSRFKPIGGDTVIEELCEDIDETVLGLDCIADDVDDTVVGTPFVHPSTRKAGNMARTRSGHMGKFHIPSEPPSSSPLKRKSLNDPLDPVKRTKCREDETLENEMSRVVSPMNEVLLEDDIGVLSDLGSSNSWADPDVADKYSEEIEMNTHTPPTVERQCSPLPNNSGLEEVHGPAPAPAPPTPNSNPAGFIQSYYSNSRLHHLSTWKTALQVLIAKHHKQFCPIPSNRFPRRYIFHADFDAFFASVSGREYLLKKTNQARQTTTIDMKNTPIAVAHGNGPTTCIASCNYPARKFGIKNGDMLKHARARCNDLVVVGYEFPAYEKASRQFYDTVLEMFGKKGCMIRAVSVDEMVVDATCLVYDTRDPTILEVDRATALASDLRSQVLAKTGCTISVGIGPNLLLARIALKQAKPNGQGLIIDDESEIRRTLNPLPVRDIPGIGWQLAAQMQKDWGANTIHDLRQIGKSKLEKAFGPKMGEKIWNSARGIDDEEVGQASDNLSNLGEEQTGKKTIGAEITWGVRLNSIPSSERFLTQLCVEVHARLNNAGVRCQNLMVKIMRRAEGAPENPAKYLGHGDCVTVCKSVALVGPADAVPVLAKAAIGLLRRVVRETLLDSKDIRGLGVHVSGLTIKGGSQQALNFGPKSKSKDVDNGLVPTTLQSRPLTPPRTRTRDAEDGDIVTPTKPCPREDAELAAASGMFAPSVGRLASDPISTPKFKIDGHRTVSFKQGPGRPSPFRPDPYVDTSSSTSTPTNHLSSTKAGQTGSSFRSRLNLAGSQFFLPTQVDPEVLAELPEDIRARLRRPENRAQESPCRAPIRNVTSGRTGSTTVLANTETGRVTTNSTRSLQSRMFDLDADLVSVPLHSPAPPRSRQAVLRFPSTPSRLFGLPSASQLDPDSLAALPVELQNEILRQYAEAPVSETSTGLETGRENTHDHTTLTARTSLLKQPPVSIATAAPVALPQAQAPPSGPTGQTQKGRTTGAGKRGPKKKISVGSAPGTSVAAPSATSTTSGKGNMTLAAFMARQSSRVGGGNTNKAFPSPTLTTMPPPPSPQTLLPRTPGPLPRLGTLNHLNKNHQFDTDIGTIPSSPAIPLVSPSFLDALPTDLRNEAVEQGSRMVKAWEWEKNKRRREKLRNANNGGAAIVSPLAYDNSNQNNSGQQGGSTGMATISKFLPPLRLPSIQTFQPAVGPDVDIDSGSDENVNEGALQSEKIPGTISDPTAVAAAVIDTSLASLRLLVSSWTDMFSRGPYPEDVSALTEYLEKVVIGEKDMAKAVGVGEWLKWKVEQKMQGKVDEDRNRNKNDDDGDDDDDDDDVGAHGEDIITWSETVKVVMKTIKIAIRGRTRGDPFLMI